MNSHTKQILEQTSDPHNRVQQLQRDIKRITTAKENKTLLEAFNVQLEKDFHKGKLSISGWQKSISESIAFARFFNKPINKLTRKDIEKWWHFQEKRQMDGKITAWTVRKLVSQARKFYRFVLKSPQKKYIDDFDWINEQLPAKPKRKFTASDLPSQEDIKRLLQALYYNGRGMGARNRALFSLCNDVGCRVSEALEIRNKDVTPEHDYLIISLPQSKTESRSVVSILARPHLEEWSKKSPNKNKGASAPFFCDSRGRKLKYAVVRKALNTALGETGIKFPKNKATHFFRGMFASRSFAWPKVPRNYWMGWSNGISDSYTAMNYKSCVAPYTKMLRDENNPMLGPEKPYWEEDTEKALIAKLAERSDFQIVLRQMLKELGQG